MARDVGRGENSWPVKGQLWAQAVLRQQIAYGMDGWMWNSQQRVQRDGVDLAVDSGWMDVCLGAD